MAVGCVAEVARLTGFSCRKMYGHFVETKQTDHDNEMTVRQVFTVTKAGEHILLLTSMQHSVYCHPSPKKMERKVFLIFLEGGATVHRHMQLQNH